MVKGEALGVLGRRLTSLTTRIPKATEEEIRQFGLMK
jgi:hypothetical protein